MNVPHYVNETKSDIRCIKPGWYAMNEDGNLSSGPFVSREERLSRGIQVTNEDEHHSYDVGKYSSEVVAGRHPLNHFHG